MSLYEALFKNSFCSRQMQRSTTDVQVLKNVPEAIIIEFNLRFKVTIELANFFVGFRYSCDKLSHFQVAGLNNAGSLAPIY